ncbi:MAG: hypothetical protein U0P81_10715 [Holophagaceae bacterium]
MHPYAPPRAPLLRPDPVFELRRTARGVGLGAVAGVVALATAWTAHALGADVRFLAVHAACALAALGPVGLLGGPYVAFQGTGSWQRWAAAVLRVALLALAAGGLGVALGGRVLRLQGHPSPYGALGPASLPAGLWLGLGCTCLALAWTGLAGVILRVLAQRWVEAWAPDPAALRGREGASR